ncbi:MAG: chemotaxis protein CheW [Thiofilum sp.]|uniref:chemotaxis protein CheW n=1 Tax=Thiofilum sp. TaxID=2212733 RepID=UPI0025EA2B30|nr:chemotaxis protein CheW [Thiofilum sp.]MBK8453074.1 chemotaxis protein CheW [Thiofilum sp.]
MKLPSVDSLKCAVLRLHEGNLIFPISLLAELVTNGELEDSTTQGLEGWLTWRSRRVPVIALESLCKTQYDSSSTDSKYLILHTVSTYMGLPFIAIRVQGGMQIVDLKEDNLRNDYSGNLQRCPYVARQVRISKLLCFIPDLPAIEKMLVEVLQIKS